MAQKFLLTIPTKNMCINLIANSERGSKQVKTACTGEKKDKISQLPDAILGQILSSFTTKEAVRTSILSTQWRYIWTSVPNLDFDDELLLHDKKRPLIEIRECFKDFVDRVLNLHSGSSLKKFSLICHQWYGFQHFTKWIDTAISDRIIEEIYIFSRHVLPPKFFINEKLKVLSLYEVTIKLPKRVHFPKLNMLTLEHVDSIDEISMNNLLSGCPVLEMLNVLYYDLDALQISSSSLKNLKIHCITEAQHNENTKLVIETPNVRFLELGNRVIEEYRVCRFPLLEEVVLDIGQVTETFVREDVYGQRLLELLQILSNVKDLTLHTLYFMHIHNDLPIFPKLTRLNFEFYEVMDGDILFEMLQKSPILQRIVIINNLDNDDGIPDIKREWNLPSACVVPKCLVSCLEIIELSGIYGHDGEIQMIAYLLEHALVLKKMVIKSRVSLSIDIKFYLLSHTRGSPKSAVVFQFP